MTTRGTHWRSLTAGAVFGVTRRRERVIARGTLFGDEVDGVAQPLVARGIRRG